MKNSEKKGIIILILVSVVIIGIIFMITRGNKNKKEGTNNVGSSNSQMQVTENGTKQATSNKLNETKTVGSFEISNIQITETNGLAEITASVKNVSGTTKKEFPMTLKLKNKEGEILQEVGAYVGTIKDEETRGIHASVNMDISQVYDIDIEL